MLADYRGRRSKVMNPVDLLKPWHELPIVVIDFETTGVDEDAKAVEIGVVRFDGGEVTEKYGTFINPGVPIPKEATEIHGITDEMVKDAPNMGDAITGIGSHVATFNCAPAAYNAPFDRRFWPFDNASDEYLTLLEAWPWLDPLVLVRHFDRYVSGKGRHKLTAVCERRNIEMGTAHRAVDDAEATGKVLYSYREQLGDITLPELLRRQAINAKQQEADFKAWLAKQPAQEGSATP